MLVIIERDGSVRWAGFSHFDHIVCLSTICNKSSFTVSGVC